MGVEVRNVVERVIRSVAEEQSLNLPEVKDGTAIVDELGFSSMMVAILIASLEDELGVDPFMDDDVMITDVRTVEDLCAVYARSLRRVH